jgi:hypothetical protein
MAFGFWVATWEETAVWWHTRRRDHHTRGRDRHAHAVDVLQARHHARVVSWTAAGQAPARGSAVTTRLPRPRGGGS